MLVLSCSSQPTLSISATLSFYSLGKPSVVFFWLQFFLHQYYTLFLVDDKEYELYDENNNIIQSITGKDLEEHVLTKKKEIDKLYSY